MKTFQDLKFEPHPLNIGTIARMFFDNGFGVSVISGHLFYCSEEAPYEVAILKDIEENYELCCDTDLTDDVLGYNTEDDVTEIMKKVQEL